MQNQILLLVIYAENQLVLMICNELEDNKKYKWRL